MIPSIRTARRSLATLLLPLVAACVTTDADPADGGRTPAGFGSHAARKADESPEQELAWTEEFTREGLVIADEVTIEGPPGLLDHVVVEQDATNHSFETRTLSQGLLQECLLLEDGLRPIRGQLDAVRVMALRRLRVLVRPGDVDVVLMAEGDVFWKPDADSPEQRAPSLQLVGQRTR